MDWDSILSIDLNDPNISIENFHNNIIYILDEFAPFKKTRRRSAVVKRVEHISTIVLVNI